MRFHYYGDLMDVRTREDNILSSESIRLMKFLIQSEEEPVHSHDFIEIEYIWYGSGVQIVNDVMYDVCKGTVLFFNIGDVHSYYSDTEMGVINCLITPEFIHDDLVTSANALDILRLAMFHDFKDSVKKIPNVKFYTGNRFLYIDALFHNLCNEFDRKESGYITVLKSSVNILLTDYFRGLKNDSSEEFYNGMKKITPDILAYIEGNYNKKISLNDLAKISYYNPSYFSAVFKESMGKTVTEYICEMRISAAIKLLDETQLSVEQICNDVGYNDKKLFYKNFKASTGMTPNSYRKQKQSNN